MFGSVHSTRSAASAANGPQTHHPLSFGRDGINPWSVDDGSTSRAFYPPSGEQNEECRTSRSTEWRPRDAGRQFGCERRATIGELIVRPCSHAHSPSNGYCRGARLAGEIDVSGTVKRGLFLLHFSLDAFDRLPGSSCERVSDLGCRFGAE